MESIGLYLHFPFCRAKCAYCDFPSEAGQDALIEPYLAALEKEMAFYQGLGVNTLYLGGGTPSLMSSPQLEHLFQAIHRHFAVDADAEITMEVNPATGSPELWGTAVNIGVNRISMGAQSFCDRLLRHIGRVHDARAIHKTVQEFQVAGIQNFSLDLMYGLPDQSLKDWRQSLETAVGLKPKHLSLYSLSVEEGTPFSREQRRGSLILPTEDEEVAMAEMANTVLRQAGMQRYEIASWAIPGFESRHNLGYWRLDPYVGLGTGAHSYYQHRRYAHSRDLKAYLKDPLPMIPSEPLTQREEMEEFMFLGLRKLVEGVAPSRFHRRFGVSLDEIYGNAIRHLRSMGMLEMLEDRLVLTGQAVPVANNVFMEFLEDND